MIQSRSSYPRGAKIVALRFFSVSASSRRQHVDYFLARSIDSSYQRGVITPEDVMKMHDGDERDSAIFDWCRSVWEDYRDNRETIIDLLQRHRVI